MAAVMSRLLIEQKKFKRRELFQYLTFILHKQNIYPIKS